MITNERKMRLINGITYLWVDETYVTQYDPIITPHGSWCQMPIEESPKQPNEHINYLASLGGKKKKNKKVRSWDK